MSKVIAVNSAHFGIIANLFLLDILFTITMNLSQLVAGGTFQIANIVRSLIK